MAQSGLHGLVGLALTQMGGQEADGFETRAGGMKWGFVVGNILPDVDMFVVALMSLPGIRGLVTYPPGVDPSDVFHRTWSHSLVTQAVVCLLAYFLWARRNPQRQGLVSGLWLGMLVHSATDLLLWFAPENLLWPLDRLGFATTFNAWAPFDPKSWDVVRPLHILQNLMGAGEFLTLGLLLGYLARIVKATKIEVKHLRFLQLAKWGMYALALAAGILAFFLAGPGDKTYNLVVYPVFLVAGLPIEGWALWHLREAIAGTPALLRRRAA